MRPFVLLALLVGCQGEAPADAPSPPDVARDVPFDAPVDLPLTLEEGPSFSGCDPWAFAEETQPRGLPAGAMPRVLWRWIPDSDPLWNMTPLFPEDREVHWVARSMDGALWAIVGNAMPRMVRLSREGVAQMISTRVPSSRPPIVLPDGRVWLLHHTRDQRVEAVEVSPDGTLRPMLLFTAPASRSGRLEAAVGPDSLYLTVPRAIASICPDGSMRWVLRGNDAQYLADPWVDGSGELWVHMLGPRGIRWVNVSRAGIVAEETGDHASWNLAGSESLLTRWSMSSGQGVIEVRAGPVTRWSATIERSTRVCWDARGGAWVQGELPFSGAPPIRRIDERGTVFETEAGVALAPIHRCRYGFGEDGSLFGSLVSITSVDVGVRDALDGRLRWQLSLGPPSGGVSSPILLGPDGAAYFADDWSVVAVQTDLLPPEEPYCLGDYCGNSRLDGAARRFPD